MNMKDLQLYAKICLEELDAIGVEYGNIVEFSINTRAKSRWGQCRYNRATKEYKINIASILLTEEASEKALKDTLFHEIIHTCDGCFDHGREWQSVADLVNDCYAMNIKRCTTSEEKGVDLERTKNYKYYFKCSKCGQVVKRQRESQFTRMYSKYGCGRCGEFGTFMPM